MLSNDYAKTLLIDAVETGCTDYWSTTDLYSPTKGEARWVEMDVDDWTVISTHFITYTAIQHIADEFTMYALKHLPGIKLNWDDMDGEMLDCLIQYICFKEVRYG